MKQAQDVERIVAAPMMPVFRRSVRETAKAIAALEIEPQPERAREQAVEIMTAVFNVENEKAAIIEAAGEILPTVFALGAISEMELNAALLKQAGAKTTAQDMADALGIDADGFSINQMPPWLRAAAARAMGDAFDQDYWQQIPMTTRDDIGVTLMNAIRDGLSMTRVAAEINRHHGGEYSAMRAMRVARTEIPNALNGGHSEGIRRLSEETGLVIGKEWLSVLGSTTRDSHAAMDGQQTPTPDGLFTLAGVEVPWPAHPSLPAGERINCQCTVISAIVTSQTFPEDEPPEPPKQKPKKKRQPASMPSMRDLEFVEQLKGGIEPGKIGTPNPSLEPLGPAEDGFFRADRMFGDVYGEPSVNGAEPIDGVRDLTTAMETIENDYFVATGDTVDSEETTIRPDLLVGTQNYLHQDGLAKYEDNRERAEVVKLGGRYYIRDGHHRAAAQIWSGEKRIRVHLVDLDKAIAEAGIDVDQAVIDKARRAGRLPKGGVSKYKDADGNFFVVKKGSSSERLVDEFVANELYRAAGVKVPESKMTLDFSDDPEGEPMMIQRFIDGPTMQDLPWHTGPRAGSGADQKKSYAKLRKDFATDALFGNSDVIGHQQNIRVDAKGQAYRMDTASALTRSGREFGDNPVELWSFRDPTIFGNKETAKVFKMSPKTVLASAKKTLKKRKAIMAKVAQMERDGFIESRPGPGGSPLRRKLEARFDAMQDYVDTVETVRADKYTWDFADDLTRHEMLLKERGVTRRLPEELLPPSRSRQIGVLRDEYGDDFDHLRDRGTIVNDLIDHVKEQGGDYQMFENYQSAQGGSSWSTESENLKMHLALSRDAPLSSYYWGGDPEIEAAVKKGKPALEKLLVKRLKMSGYDPDAYRTTMISQQAFTLQMLKKTDLPNNNRKRGVISLGRTESSGVIRRNNFQEGETKVIQRGAAESFGLTNTVSVGGSNLTYQEVPHHRVFATYLQTARRDGRGGAFLGNGENEFITMGEGMPSYYHGRVTPGTPMDPTDVWKKRAAAKVGGGVPIQDVIDSLSPQDAETLELDLLAAAHPGATPDEIAAMGQEELDAVIAQLNEAQNQAQNPGGQPALDAILKPPPSNDPFAQYDALVGMPPKPGASPDADVLTMAESHGLVWNPATGKFEDPPSAPPPPKPPKPSPPDPMADQVWSTTQMAFVSTDDFEEEVTMLLDSPPKPGTQPSAAEQAMADDHGLVWNEHTGSWYEPPF